MRRDPRVWALVAVAGIAFGAGTAWGARGPTSAGAARVAANRILAAVRLPSGATRTRHDPSGSRLAKPATFPLTPNLVDAHQFWRVPGDPQTVFNWIEDHPPAGTTVGEAGAVGERGTVVLQYAGFALLRPRRGGAPSETLLLTVAAAQGGGTAVRADGQVVWLLERSLAERVPGGAHAVIVSERRGSGRRGPWTVTDSARVKRAMAIIDGLPVAQPGVVAGGAEMGPFVTLTFTTAPRGGRTLATAHIDGGGYGFVRFWIRGHPQHALQGSPSLISSLSSALGISLG